MLPTWMLRDLSQMGFAVPLPDGEDEDQNSDEDSEHDGLDGATTCEAATNGDMQTIKG